MRDADTEKLVLWGELLFSARHGQIFPRKGQLGLPDIWTSLRAVQQKLHVRSGH